MGTPQIIYLAVNLFGLGVIAAKTGQPREGKHNVLVSGGLWCAVILPLLYWGGFFS